MLTIPDLFAAADRADRSLPPIYLIAFEDLRPGTAAYGNTVAKLAHLAHSYDTELVMARPSDGRLRRYLSAFRLAAECRRNGGIYAAAYRLFLRRASLIVTATTGLADHARTMAPNAQVIIAPAAAPDVSSLWAVSANKKPPVKNPKQVAYFGTFAPWQGAELLLDAVNDPAWPDGVELVVIGDASKSPVGGELASHERVRALGRLPHADTLRTVAESLCSLSPKTYQVDAEVKTGLWPVTVIESLAVGTAVIGTKIEDQLSLIEASNGGVLIDPTGADIAAAVRALCDDPESTIAMGEAGRKHVEAKHSLDLRADLIADCLGELCLTGLCLTGLCLTKPPRRLP